MRYFISIALVFIVLQGCVKRQSAVFLVDSKPFMDNFNYFKSTNDDDISLDWQVIVYINKGANLSCFEDMDSWREMEKIVENYNGHISIWTNKNDSSDVFWALKLEKLNTSFQIIDSTKLKELKWDKLPTHYKVLLDKKHKLISNSEELLHDSFISNEIKELLNRFLFYNR